MKLKYYLRGIGTGMIVTTLILAISFSFRKPEMTDEEIRQRAQALGMVMQEDSQTTEEKKVQETEEQGTMTPPADTQATGQEAPSAGTPTAEQEVLPPDAGTTAQTPQEPAQPDNAQGTPENGVPADQSGETGGSFHLVIESGDVCRIVCEKLQKNGLIADAQAMRSHMSELGYANSIRAGAYEIPYGLTMEEVAQVIIAGPIE